MRNAVRRYKRACEQGVQVARMKSASGCRRSKCWVSLSVLLVAVSLGCSAKGPGRLVSSHEGYNDAVQLVTSREVLKNIVRMRYADPVQFLSVSTINASFSVSTSANAGVSGSAPTGGPSSLGAQTGASVAFSDSPTLTFTPVKGSGAMQSLESPIALNLILNHAFNMNELGTEIPLFFSAINNAADREGPAGDLYGRRIAALQRLMELGCRFGLWREFYPRTEPFAAGKHLNARAYVEAAVGGFYFVDVGNGRLVVASKHLQPGLVVPEPDNREVVDQLRILDVEPGSDFYFLRDSTDLHPPNSQWSPLPDGRVVESIYITPRSVLSVMMVAAKSVMTPTEHDEIGISPPRSMIPVSTSLDLPLRIKVSQEEPTDLYRVAHRGYWFRIDDSDHESKQIFSTIVYAYGITLSSRSDADDTAPVLTLPIGGR